jgi:CheY-like chemotaxis protein
VLWKFQRFDIFIQINGLGKRCLLVEDMKVNQKMMQHMLMKENISVQTAKNGLEGFNVFKVN